MAVTLLGKSTGRPLPSSHGCGGVRPHAAEGLEHPFAAGPGQRPEIPDILFHPISFLSRFYT